MPKGTYYIRIVRKSWNGNGKISVKFTYPSGSSVSNNSGNTGKVKYIGITMKVGDTMTLYTIADPADSDIVWNSSKKSVATVSDSGKVTALKAGSTVITAKSGKSKQKIVITVIDD